jgi:hypothetical protein
LGFDLPDNPTQDVIASQDDVGLDSYSTASHLVLVVLIYLERAFKLFNELIGPDLENFDEEILSELFSEGFV